MAEQYAVGEGVTRTDCFWGYYLEGTRDALMKAGLAEPEWFADGTERNAHGRVVRTKYFKHAGRDCECVMEQRKGWYHLRFIYTPTELNESAGGRCRREAIEAARGDTGFQRFLEKSIEARPVRRRRFGDSPPSR